MDLVYDLRNYEERCIPNNMSISREDLDVVELFPITLTPPLICQVRENQMIRQMNEIYRIRKEHAIKIHIERDTS